MPKLFFHTCFLSRCSLCPPSGSPFASLFVLGVGFALLFPLSMPYY